MTAGFQGPAAILTTFSRGNAYYSGAAAMAFTQRYIAV